MDVLLYQKPNLLPYAEIVGFDPDYDLTGLDGRGRAVQLKFLTSPLKNTTHWWPFGAIRLDYYDRLNP